jgi:hypothetical protein
LRTARADGCLRCGMPRLRRAVPQNGCLTDKSLFGIDATQVKGLEKGHLGSVSVAIPAKTGGDRRAWEIDFGPSVGEPSRLSSAQLRLRQPRRSQADRLGCPCTRQGRHCQGSAGRPAALPAGLLASGGGRGQSCQMRSCGYLARPIRGEARERCHYLCNAMRWLSIPARGNEKTRQVFGQIGCVETHKTSIFTGVLNCRLEELQYYVINEQTSGIATSVPSASLDQRRRRMS